MKVIFLDIDGVMNNNKCAVSEKHENLEFDPLSVKLLKDLMDKTGAKIVLTSTWRIGNTMGALKERIFIHYGLDEYIVGLTPYYPEEIRGIEIQEYLKHHRDITHFVILDDFPDMGELSPYLVRTKTNKGFTEKEYSEALTILSSNVKGS